MCGLGVGISTVFEISGHFLFKGDRTILYGHYLYIPSDVPLHKEQEYIKFRGGDLNSFQDIQKYHVSVGDGVDSRGHI
jgi:hypothetical protein